MSFEKRKGRVFYICPDVDSPTGGIKKIYQHVDILGSLGLSAFVLHQKPAFRCSWFHNTTPIAYIRRINEPLLILHANGKQESIPPVCSDDILVVPEVSADKLVREAAHAGLYTVIFNQNAYYTFLHTPPPNSSFSEGNGKTDTVYNNKNLLGVIIVSEENKNYLEYTFPTTAFFRVHISIDFTLFSYQKEKKKQIAFMPRKCGSDSMQIVSILHQRGLLNGWSLAPIHNMTETQVAKMLKESAIFMSFSYQEGLGLPPIEALSCGSIVIGYHGGGGKEYFQGPTIFPIPQGEIIEYAKTVERVALDYAKNPLRYLEMTLLAKNVIQKAYSAEKEKEDLAHIWQALFKKHEGRNYTS